MSSMVMGRAGKGPRGVVRGALNLSFYIPKEVPQETSHDLKLDKLLLPLGCSLLSAPTMAFRPDERRQRPEELLCRP